MAVAFGLKITESEDFPRTLLEDSTKLPKPISIKQENSQTNLKSYRNSSVSFSMVSFCCSNSLAASSNVFSCLESAE